MSDNFSIFGVVLGLLGIFTLFVSTMKFERPKPSLSEALVVFLSAAAISAGIKVCALAFDSIALTVSDSERLYVFIGGLAVTWISWDAIWKTLTVKENRQ